MSSDQASTTSGTTSGGLVPKTSKLLSVSVISPLEIDHANLRLFELWLDGMPVRDAANEWKSWLSPTDLKLLRRLTRGQNREQRLEDVIVEHAFTEFAVLGHHLSRPSSFASLSFAIQASPALVTQLILRYYALDEVICRSLIGRKLKARSKSTRRGPDDASHNAHEIQHRVLANVQQVYEFYLGSLNHAKYQEMPVILRFCEHFMFPERLSAQYSRLMFLLLHRFDISKRRLTFLRMSHLDFLAHVMLSYWCYPGTVQIDKELLEALRRKPAASELPYPPEAYKRKRIPEAIIKSVVRIGNALNNPKDFEDIFEDIHEKVVEPLIREDFAHTDVLDFFGVKVAPVPLDKAATPWSRYIEVIAHIIATMIKNQESGSPS